MLLVETGLMAHRTGSYARATGRRLSGVGAQLARLLHG
jgi:hypothetical protein